MRAKVFVPGHITGFFEVLMKESLLYSGSRGCGVVIDKGVETLVEVEESEKTKIQTFINNKEQNCRVTKFAVKELLNIIAKPYKIKIYHKLGVPMMQGFGTSASGTLGAILALNKALKLNLTLNQCSSIAHKSEVINKTGMGDVIAEVNGGVVIRLSPGAPGIGRIDKIPFEGYVAMIIAGKPIETKKILRDETMIRRINEIGRACMNKILKEPTVENFLRISYFFAKKTKLMSKKIEYIIEGLRKKDILASMVMLGNSIFTVAEDPDNLKELESLGYDVILTKINNEGIKIEPTH